MISLPYLRHAFAAAFGALLLVILMAGFVMPNGVIVCGPGDFAGLPNSRRATVWHGSETDLSISIKQDGTLLIGKRIVSAKEFQSHLSAAYGLMPGRRVVVRPDRRSPFGATRLVIRAVQSLGVRKVVIDTGVRSVVGSER